jgi:hypothetical protein
VSRDEFAEEVGFVPPPPLAQLTLTEMSEAIDRLELVDTDLMRAILRGLLYERDMAAARVARSLRRLP